MRDENPMAAVKSAPATPSRFAQWGNRLMAIKVTPLVVVVFIALLGLFCFAAATVGHVVHGLAR